MKQSKFDGTKVIVSRGVKGLSAEDEHPMGGKPKAMMLDQHAWMNPRNGIIYVKNITDALVRLDPANAADVSQPSRVIYPGTSGLECVGASRDGRRAGSQAPRAFIT